MPGSTSISLRSPIVTGDVRPCRLTARYREECGELEGRVPHPCGFGLCKGGSWSLLLLFLIETGDRRKVFLRFGDWINWKKACRLPRFPSPISDVSVGRTRRRCQSKSLSLLPHGPGDVIARRSQNRI
jgi:hypothetical protein